MKVINDYPPNYQDIVAALGEVEQYNPIFCYNGVIYNPFNIDVTPDLHVHEEVHERQQNGMPEAWWFSYLSDPAFRLEQEMEAYCEQYKFALDNGVTGKLKDWLRNQIALSLSSPLYGSIISYGQADSKLRHYVKS